MIFPKYLKEGGTVGLIAPSSPITNEECRRCKEWLEEKGYGVRLGKTLMRGDTIRGYLAGEAKERAEDFNRMFEAEEVEAVFCVRGGYGSVQMLEYLNYEAIRNNPKIFIGYSDVTAIHCALQNKCNLVTFHGPMIKSNFLCDADKRSGEYSWRQLLRVLQMKEELEFQNPVNQATEVIKSGYASGKLVGGNLSVIARLLGTDFSLDTKDSILFLEDVGETLARLEMYLSQMKLAGVFRNVKGILLGDFTACCNGERGPSETKEFIHSWFQELQVPIISNVCSDHRKPMATLPLGTFCEVDTETGKIVFHVKKKEKFILR